MNAIDTQVQKLGDENSVWFKLSALARGDNDNPMPVLLKLAERYGPHPRQYGRRTCPPLHPP